MYKCPRTAPGMRIGLLGGSFDPPHGGHVHISEVALRRLGLNRVWWLVSPGNPLKEAAPADMSRRLSACRELVQNPHIRVTDVESRIKTRFTADTLAAIKRLYPSVHFVWLMGADNMVDFHKWERWDWIMQNIPVCVLARPDQQVSAGLAPAARRYQHSRLPQYRARELLIRKAPQWTLLTGVMSPLSSTLIRARGEWRR